MGPENIKESNWLFGEGETYLKRTFLEGEETGRKQSAVDVCSKMKTLRDGNGRKMFNKEDWLAAGQIARYFSRLSVIYRSGRLAIDQADPSAAQDEEEDFVAGRRDQPGLKYKDSWNYDETTKLITYVILPLLSYLPSFQ